MAYMKDATGRRLDSFVPLRDLPNTFGHWDASTLTEAVGQNLKLWRDATGLGHDFVQFTDAKRPVVAAGPNGNKVLALATDKYMTRTGMGAGDWMEPAGYAQPLTQIFVIRGPSATPTTNRYILTGGTTVATTLNVGSCYISAGGGTPNGGPNLLDGQWHILVAVFGTTGNSTYIDGQLVQSNSSQSHGSAALAAPSMGASSGGGNVFGGDIAEIILCQSRLTEDQIAKVSSVLGAKWGITVGTPQYLPTPEQTTSPNGQAVRIWEPKTLAAGAPLIIFNHQFTGSEQIGPGAAQGLYALIQAAHAEGWRVAASNQHGNNWGNQSSIDDVVDLYNMMNTRQAVTKVVVTGASMGGLSASLLVPDGRIPIKGALLFDAVTNLADVYSPAAGFSDYSGAINTSYGVTAGTLSGATSAAATSIPTTASFPTIGTQLIIGYGTSAVETVTTTGASTGTAVAVTATANAHASGDKVSDYPTKSAGHDPQTRSASDYTGVRWRFYSSLNDTSNVKEANNIVLFAAKVAAAPEATVVTHWGGHLDGSIARPADFVAYVKRCIA